MGRYDKIKVRHNNQWKTPREIKVYDGTNWVSLGGQDEQVHKGKELKVKNGNDWVRVTNDWIHSEETVDGDSHSVGQFTLRAAAPSTQYETAFDYRPSGSRGKQWLFYTEGVRRTNNASGNIVKVTNGTRYAQAYFNSDGTVSFQAHYNKTLTLTSKYAVPVNQWVRLWVWSPANTAGTSSTMNIEIVDENGYVLETVQPTISNQGYEWNTNMGTETNYIGDNNVQFKENSILRLKGVHWENVEHIWDGRVTSNICSIASDSYTIDNSHWEN